MTNTKTLKTIANALNEIATEAKKNNIRAGAILKAWDDENPTKHIDIITKLNEITTMCEEIYKSYDYPFSPREDIEMYLICIISSNYKVTVKKSLLALAEVK